MTTKKLQIISSTHAREINPFERPELGRDKEYSFTDTSTKSIIYHDHWHKRMN